MAESGWYPDPNNGELERYWDGNAWSTSTRPRTAAEPVYPTAPVYPAAPTYQADPAVQADPGYPAAPSYQPNPGYAADPGYPAAPTYQPNPGYVAAPGYPSAPANQGYQAYPSPQHTGPYVPFGTQAQVGTVGATWGRRLLAYLIDAAIGGVPLVIAYAIFFVTLTASSATDNGGPAAIGLLVVAVGGLWAVGFFIYNVLIRQGNTGQTIGKSKIGLRLVTEATGSPPGLGMSLARYFAASAVSSLTCGIFGVLDYLWPLWDPRRQRIVDKWFHLMVVDLKQG